MKVYKANKKGIIRYVLIGLIVLAIGLVFWDKDGRTKTVIDYLALLAPLLLFTWFYFDTFYKIESNELFYRSAFLRGKIKISTIHEIQKGKTMWGGIKPALAKHGLIIKFNKYDEIYIAPESNDELISDLLRINSDIKIIESF